MKKLTVKISLLITALLLMLSLTACVIGELGGGSDDNRGNGNGNSDGDSGNSDASSGKDEVGDEGEVQSPEELEGKSIISAAVVDGNKLKVTVTGGKSVELGSLGFKDGGRINIEYNKSLADALGIIDFKAIGKDEVAIVLAEGEIICLGKVICAHDFDPWQLTGENCTDELFTRTCKSCGDTENKSEEKTGEHGGHDIVTHAAKEPSCSGVGWREYVTCNNCDYTTYFELSAPEHLPEALVGYPATETEYGLSDGSRCSLCLTVIIPQHKILPTGYKSLDNYSGDYGYEYLGTMNNGAALQAFYTDIDTAVKSFHTSLEDLTENTFAKVNFSNKGLTQSEALAVYSTYQNDNPLYYWLGSSVSYTTTELYLQTDEEYRLGETRAEYNELVYGKVKEYAELTMGYKDTYHLSLLLHDGIIGGMEYAYEADGVTPSSEASAHNILGALIFGEGVCESYARAFQLLLNYSGKDNILVTGESRGEAHAWNLLKLDDGEYYWYDLTWDDTPDYMLGISYNYFAVDDNSVLNRLDFGWTAAKETTFLTDHTPTVTLNLESTEAALSFLYELPQRADSSMPLSALRIRFNQDGLEFVRIGQDSVIVSSIPSGNVIIPDKVSYSGREYTVAAIGSVDDNYLLGREGIGNGTTSLKLSETVRFVSDMALHIDTLQSITVDESNPYYSSLDGALYTKNFITLVKYPEAKAGTSYRIPDTVLYAAHGSLFYLQNIEVIEVGENLKCFGYTFLGYEYCDSADVPADNQIFNNEIANIKNSMYSRGEIRIDENNPNFITKRK